MSSTVATIVLDASGSVVRACRVLSPDGHGDPTWRVWASGGHGLSAEPGELAEWIVEVLRDSSGPSDRLGRIVVTGPSVRCHWLSVPSAEEKVVRGSVAQGRPSAWGDWSTGGEEDDTASVLDGGAVALQAVAAPEEPAWPGRLAGLAVADTAVRVLLDELDAHKVQVGATLTLGQAIASAWDPGAVTTRSDDEQTVDASDQPTAVVLIDLGDMSWDDRASPGAGSRLAWSWSKSGSFVAGGSKRLGRGPEAIREASARLSADWMGWAAEIGFAPSRVVAVFDPRAADPQDVRAGLAALPGGVAIDAVTVEDPVAASLERLARRGMKSVGAVDDGRASLVSLSTRPGRHHRAMYLWLSAAMLMVAGALGVLGWKQRAAADEYLAAARTAEQSWRAALSTDFPDLATDPFALNRLNDQLATLREKLKGPGEDNQPKPLLEELDTLAFVLGSVDGIVLLEAGLRSDLAATHSVLVPDFPTGDDLVIMLNSASKHIEYRGQFVDRNRGRADVYNARQFPELKDHVRMTLEGSWREKRSDTESEGGVISGGGGA